MSNKTNIQQQNLFPVSEDSHSEAFRSQKQPLTEFNPFPYIDKVLIESQEQTKVNKTRQVLGQNAKNISDEQLETFAMQFEYLINCWLDLYEKQLFDGKTLREISEI